MQYHGKEAIIIRNQGTTYESKLEVRPTFFQHRYRGVYNAKKINVPIGII